MKIYGKTDRGSESPQQMEEVTLVVSKDEVMALLGFLSKCLDEMKTNPHWEHSHLQDYLGKHEQASDIVVFSAENQK